MYSDCVDGEDEIDCGDRTVDNRTEVCKADEFVCLEHHFCVHSSWTCDGDRDCPDGSDESQEVCKDGVECESEEFRCDDSQCIPEYSFCDGVEHCDDLSDEKKGCIGKKPMEVSHNVSNMNSKVLMEKCLSWPPVCSQACISTPGGYKCDCIKGYTKVGTSSDMQQLGVRG